jgi:Domain of unknown function (DUF4249)
MSYKKKITGAVLAISLILTIGACVEPIVPALKDIDTESMLVVDGKITDEVGPFRVRLTNSVKVNAMFYLDPVRDADVRIYDDKGNIFQLYSDNYGWYESEDKKLMGIPGNSYTLSITTSDGTQYESSSVMISAVTDIDSLYFNEAIHTRFEGNQNIEETWLNIFLDTHDPEGKIRYWYFEFDETWEVKILTENVTVEHSPPGEPNDITLENVDVSEEQKVCWVTKPSKSILIASTQNSAADELKGFPLQSLGPSEDKLHIRYSIHVKQSSINQELYNFWKQLKDVNEDVGGLYEKMPSQVFGNITCCGGNSKALGYFSAMSVNEKRLFIDKSEHHVQTKSAYDGCSYYDFEQLPWVPKSYFGKIKDTGKNVYCSTDFCADCRTYGTNVKPDFWQ